MAITPTIPQVWSARITHFVSELSAFLPHATRAYEGDAVYGNTIKIPTVDRSVTVRDYSRTADLAAPEDIDATTQDLLIDQEKYFSFALEDLDARQSRIGGATLVDIKSQGAGLEMADVVDDFVASKIRGIPNNTLLHNGSRAAFDLEFTADAKENMILAGLTQANQIVITTPEVVSKVEKGIIDKTYGDVVTAANFGSGNANDPLVSGNGFVFRIGGMRFYVSRSTRLRTKTDGTAVDANTRGTTSLALIYDPRDLALVMQVNKTEVYRLEKRFATGVKGLMNYGSKVLNGGRFQVFRFSD